MPEHIVVRCFACLVLALALELEPRPDAPSSGREQEEELRMPTLQSQPDREQDMKRLGM